MERKGKERGRVTGNRKEGGKRERRRKWEGKEEKGDEPPLPN